MEPRIAGHLLVECLIEQGVELAFGVPGESYLAVLDGFHVHRERIRFVTCRQEGGAAFMAEAYGKLSGRPGVCFVTRGPGATNASIGVHTACQDSTPMVLFIGDIWGGFRDREAFQEVDFAAFLGPSTRGMAKQVERVDDPARIPEYLRRAFAAALNGRPGPVVVVLPEDMLARLVEAAPLPRVEAAQAGCAPEALARLRSLLVAARQPLAVLGGQWTPAAARDFQRFAEAWQVPVANAFRHQDAFDNHHPCYAGDLSIAMSPALAARVRESDLLLVVGARLDEVSTGAYETIAAPLPRQRLVHIHAGAGELDRVAVAALALNAAVPAAAAALAALEPPPACAWQDWTHASHGDYLSNLEPELPRGIDVNEPGFIDLPALVATLQRCLPADAVVCNGAGNFSTWLHRYFRYHGLAKGLRTQLAPVLGAMGYGVPAAIAANLASGRVALALTGDGDFLMNGQELATAVLHGARIIVVLLDNGIYGTIRMHQEREYPDRVIGSALGNPDFCALARAYGLAAEMVEQGAQFEPALRRALAAAGSTLIVVKVTPNLISTRRSLGQISADARQRG